jgi:hypothetical protein
MTGPAGRPAKFQGGWNVGRNTAQLARERALLTLCAGVSSGSNSWAF